MASPTVLAPDALTDPEPWDHLSRHKARKSSLLAASLAIQAACPRDPGHATTPASGCKHCRRKIVDAISARYLSAPETEWYADRRTFLQHLAELFPAVKRGEVDASGIEDRVMDEKRRWFRESVRRIAGTAGAAGMSAEKEELARLLDDRKIKFEDFCERVREVVSRVLKTGVPEGALEKLMGAGNDAKARAEVYKEVFFFPFGEKAEVGESTRKCVEMVEQGVSMTKIAAKMLEHRKQALADRAELERLQNRIEYLKKAKATWLAQRKRREGAEEKPKAQPPCFSCGNVPDEADPLSCAVCHVAVAREIMEQTVVYCSEKCQEAAHVSSSCLERVIGEPCFANCCDRTDTWKKHTVALQASAARRYISQRTTLQVQLTTKVKFTYASSVLNSARRWPCSACSPVPTRASSDITRRSITERAVGNPYHSI